MAVLDNQVLFMKLVKIILIIIYEPNDLGLSKKI